MTSKYGSRQHAPRSSLVSRSKFPPARAFQRLQTTLRNCVHSYRAPCLDGKQPLRALTDAALSEARLCCEVHGSMSRAPLSLFAPRSIKARP
jgi:hypothetical protein